MNKKIMKFLKNSILIVAALAAGIVTASAQTWLVGATIGTNAQGQTVVTLASGASILGESLGTITNTTVSVPSSPENIVDTIAGIIKGVNTNSGVWESNRFTLFESAAFSSVPGVAGQSQVGNDLGLVVPVLKLGPQTTKTGFNAALESTTRFETLFGDVAHQQIAVMAQYNYYSLKLWAGLGARYRFTDNHLLAVPEIGADYVLVGPAAVHIGYLIPIQHKTGAGEGVVGISLPF